MLKKVSKLAVLLCMFAFTGNTFAQTEAPDVPVYPQYGFWSNWGIGVTGSFMWQPDVNQFYGVDDLYWGGGYNAGLGIFLQKEIDRGVAMRFRFNYPALFANCNKNDSNFNSRWRVADSTISMDRHTALTVDFLLSLNNSFHNWKPERRGNLYVFAGAGLSQSWNNGRAMDNAGCQLEVGLGFNYKLSERSSIFAEVEGDVIANASAFWKKGIGVHHTDFLATIGYLFNFGVTAADRALIAERALVTKEQLAALEDENDQLKQEVADVKANEQKLKNQLADMELNYNPVQQEALTQAQRVNDSLSGVLNQLKADQLTYYAIPISVLYPNDGWHVSDSQMLKVKAIARIMKDNPEVKLTVIGFCDYTASEEYNMKLSQRRAEEVKRILVKKYGIDPDRLTVDYKGKTIAFGDIKYEVNRRTSFYRVIE